MKMPTFVGIFIFISRENFMLNYVEHEKKFYSLKAGSQNMSTATFNIVLFMSKVYFFLLFDAFIASKCSLSTYNI